MPVDLPDMPGNNINNDNDHGNDNQHDNTSTVQWCPGQQCVRPACGTVWNRVQADCWA